MEARVRQETEEVRLEGSSRGAFRLEFQEHEVAEARVVSGAASSVGRRGKWSGL